MSSTVGQARPIKPGFYVTGGTLRQDVECYVERQADRDLYEALLHGEFCYVLHARQMGKSSLMAHTTARLRGMGVGVVSLDLTRRAGADGPVLGCGVGPAARESEGRRKAGRRRVLAGR